MSRIGKAPIAIPEKVTVNQDGFNISVNGPKGTLGMTVSDLVHVNVDGTHIRVSAVSDHRKSRAMHGLTRTLIQNMVTGVTAGFTKSLEIVGVG